VPGQVPKGRVGLAEGDAIDIGRGHHHVIEHRRGRHAFALELLQGRQHHSVAETVRDDVDAARA
jgi:hypothetical protein